jgi:hypothetical protein
MVSNAGREYESLATIRQAQFSIEKSPSFVYIYGSNNPKKFYV